VKGRRAFTLIELLLVVAVIAILAAMLLPALARAKDRARGVACMSNLRQLGQAVFLYMDDYADTFPRYAGNLPASQDYLNDFAVVCPWSWLGAIYPYFKHKPLAWCPKNVGYRNLDPYVGHYGVSRIMPFAYQDEGWVPVEWKRFKKRSEATQPDRRMMIYDCGIFAFYKGDELNLGFSWTSYIPGWPGNGSLGANSYLDSFQADMSRPRHSSINNAIFVDGHCEGLTPLKMVNDTVWTYP